MSRKPPVDLRAVRASRERLAKLAREHPQLTGPRSPKNLAGWVDALTVIEEDTMSNETTQCAFRLPNDLVKRLDAYAERMTEAQPGMVFTRADAVRMLLTRALDAEPAQGGKRRKGK